MTATTIRQTLTALVNQLGKDGGEDGKRHPEFDARKEIQKTEREDLANDFGMQTNTRTMAYADLETEELELQLRIIDSYMKMVRNFLKDNSGTGDQRSYEIRRLSQLKIKFELITIELVSRTDYTELENTYFDAKIDYVNTVRNERY